MKEQTGKGGSSQAFGHRKPRKKPSVFKKLNKIDVRVWLILAGLLLLLIFYIKGVVFYHGHFYRNVYINEISMRKKTVEEAEACFNEDYDAHDITLKEKERTETINARQVVNEISVDDQISKLMDRQNPWTWFLHGFGRKNYTVDLQVDYDRNSLRRIVDDLECFDTSTVTPPRDAFIRAERTKFVLVPELVGNRVDKDKLMDCLETALRHNLTRIDLEKQGLYVEPHVLKTDKRLQAALKKANRYAKSVISYDFNKEKEKVTFSTFCKWILFTDDCKVIIDEDRAADYVRGLASEYNTMGGVHSFRTSDKKMIEIVDGDYGWKINVSKERDQLVSDIKTGKETRREPVYEYRASGKYSRTNDIGDSYVEVSIKSQKIWLYLNGKCKLQSPVVTGDVPRHYDTEKGVYGITYKESPSTLTGANSNGSAYSSDVSYWMPFNGNQGLHDAPWRMTFGGSEYLGNGSHGCINCPVDTARILYNCVKKGFPVVIY